MTPEQIVSQDVHYCVSSLISELAKQESYQDDLSPILTADDWETPAREHVEALDSEELADAADYYSTDPTKEALLAHLEEQNLWQGFCEGEGTDPYTVEAYEHWIVSNWLARELASRGEMITHDFLGLTIWGRATTGQQISADYVIEQIAKDLQ